jgi:spore coat protein CotH
MSTNTDSGSRRTFAVGKSSLWVTILQAALLGIVAGLGGYLLISMVMNPTARAQGQWPPPDVQGGPPPPFGGGGFPGGAERKLVAQFDKNGDKRLDAAERNAARAALTENTGFRGFGGPGRRGGPGGPMEPGSPGPRLTPAAVTSYGNAPLYDLKTLRTIFLEFEDADWEQELAAFHNTDVEVPATVIVDGKTYKNVGVHFRGMSSFMMVPEGSKRSFNLSFDFADDQQHIGGYRTMNLLNSNGDPTFVRAVLYSEIARQYIPAPKMNYVRVAVNGESWGVYINAQQFNKDFTRDFFKSTKGARWKVPGSPGGRGGMEYLGDDPATYKRTYDIKTKDDPKAWADLITMFRVLNQTPPEKLEAALSPRLDIDGALKFLALEVALVNSDGYWARASDYSIYQDEKGMFHVLPHDFNEGLAEEGGGRGFPPRGGFGGPGGPPPGGFGGPGGPLPGGRGRGMFGRGGVDLDPLVGIDDSSKALRSKLLAVPALRERYLAYVRDIAQTWLDWQVLEPRVREYQSLIAEAVKADTRKLYSFEAFQNDVAGSDRSLKTFVDRRQEFLLTKGSSR